MTFLCLVAYLALCSVALCDYQVEIQLVQYTNSMGQLADGNCCDLCSSSDICDVHFTFRIQNLNTLTQYNSQTKGASRYDDMNQIMFTNCEQLPTTVSVAASNPLTFTIPSGDWGGSQILRMTTTIQDFDPASGSMGSSFELIATPAFDITRPASPDNNFSSDSILYHGSASITLRYRVICTDGTCGNTCSQTTGCTPWTPACGPATSSTIAPTATSPSTTASTTMPPPTTTATPPLTTAPTTAPTATPPLTTTPTTAPTATSPLTTAPTTAPTATSPLTTAPTTMPPSTTATPPLTTAPTTMPPSTTAPAMNPTTTPPQTTSLNSDPTQAMTTVNTRTLMTTSDLGSGSDPAGLGSGSVALTAHWTTVCTAVLLMKALY